MKNKYYLLVFLSGALGMVYELAAIRLLVPFYGSSSIIWTAILCTFMSSMAVGYWLGGYLADRDITTKSLANILTITAFIACILLYFNPIILVIIKTKIPNVYASSLFSSAIIFGYPTIVLAMIYPFCVTSSIDNEEVTASQIGRYSATSTIGCIAGTIVAGYLLIPHIGTSKILYCFPITMLCMAILMHPRNGSIIRILLILFIAKISLISTDSALAIVLNKDNIRTFDSPYARYMIFNEEKEGRTTINLSTDPLSIQSLRYIDSSTDFIIKGTYGEYFELSDYFESNQPTHALMLGAGGFVFPQHYNNRHPEVKVDVVEIDPALQDIAKQYFGFNPNKNLTVHSSDARQYLRETKIKYDVVFLDVFNALANIPFHLTTTEFFETLSSRMTNKGLLVFNIVSSVEGADSLLYQSMIKTLQAHFPQLYIFPAQSNEKRKLLQNITIVADKTSIRKEIILTGNKGVDKLLKSHLSNPGDLSKGIILTDNYAPTQYMVSL